MDQKEVAEFVLNLKERSKNCDEFFNTFHSINPAVTLNFAKNLWRIIETMSGGKREKKPQRRKESSRNLNQNKADTKNNNENMTNQNQNHGGQNRSQSQQHHQQPQYGEQKNEDRSRNRHRGRDQNSRDRGRDRDRGRSSHYDRNGGGDRRKHGSDRRGHQEQNNQLDDVPQKGKVYKGIVARVQDNGFFAKINGIRGHPEGLVPRNLIDPDNNMPVVRNYVKQNDEVWLVLVSGQRNKLLFSMTAVDQKTGIDRFAHTRNKPSAATLRNTSTKAMFGHIDNQSSNSSLGKRHLGDDSGKPRKRRKRVRDDQDLWMDKQIAQSGVFYQREPLDDGDDGQGVFGYHSSSDEQAELDIEINEEEPEFLKGQTFMAEDLDSVKVVKNPDGSMYHSAMIQSALAVERRDLRLMTEKHTADEVPSMDKVKQDPIAKASDRGLTYQDLVRVGKKANTISAFRAASASNVSFGKRITQTMKEQRDGLPIYKLKQELLHAVEENDMLIVVGQTGSGKTTQMTQYLEEAGYCANGRIGCTQPRRVAAMSVAKRVAEEYGCRVGQEIGYSIRFEDQTSHQTIVKYMTDGMLLREALADDSLNNYSVIILDEAHERTIFTDVLFALTKACTTRRNATKGAKKLKLIITSATLDAEGFSKYFCGCPIFTIPGRMFPVKIMYAKQAEPDYVDEALITAMNIHLSEPAGDILIFLTGKEEIDNACETLFDRIRRLKDAPPIIILPVYSALPHEQQTRIFEPAPIGERKCIIATNIAEASLTINGIYYVIDPGFVKQQVYNPKRRMNALKIVPISQNSANQRAGRAGRTGPGQCYRLYSQSAYKNEMFKSAVPEIQRTNIGNVVLMLKAMGIGDILAFDFMDKPNQATLIAAMHDLYKLGALDDEGLLTRHGRTMAEFPLDPPMSKVLMQSVDLKCTDEALTVISMLQAENIFTRPKDEQAAADSKKAKFNQPEGDQLSYLEVYRQWTENNFNSAWCRKNFVNAKAMRKAQDVRKQLVAIMDRYNLKMTSCRGRFEQVQKAVIAGFFQNIAKKDITEGYKTLKDSQPCYIHPSSSLFHQQPQWVLFSHLLETSREYMRECMSIEPGWLVELAPRHYKKTEITEISRRKRRERIEPLYKHGEQDGSWRISRVVYRDK